MFFHDLFLLKVVEGVRAAGVRPEIGEGDLLGGSLLQQQLSVGGPEDESGEGPVEETLVDVLHEVAYVTRRRSS